MRTARLEKLEQGERNRRALREKGAERCEQRRVHDAVAEAECEHRRQTKGHSETDRAPNVRSIQYSITQERSLQLESFQNRHFDNVLV